MFRHLKFAVAAAAIILAQAPASAQGGLSAIMNDDSAEAWAVCTLVSGHLGQDEPDPDVAALRQTEADMLVAVSIGRFMKQRGMTLDAAKTALIDILSARAPLYEDGSGTEYDDTGKCILAGMVSQTGEEQSARLLAAYQALAPL